MKKLIIIFLLIGTGLLMKATHNRAGEILYTRIAPFFSGSGTNTVAVYNYSISVIKYHDYGSGVAYRCADTVLFGDGNKGLALRANGTSFTCGCSTSLTAIPCGSIIINQPGFIVNKSIYTITHTYPGPGNYIISSSDFNRNMGVINIPNSISEPFYIESMLVIQAGISGNSSPELTNPPVNTGRVNQCFYHSPGAIDADGDSLTYQLIPCMSGAGQAVPGYSYPGFSNYFFINGYTGLLSWCSPVSTGEYNIAIKVHQWKKQSNGGPVYLGYVIRDMQILVDYQALTINENLNNGVSILYCNPTKKLVQVEQAGLNEVKIYNIAGALVYQNGVNNKTEINTANFEDGIYVVLMINNSGLCTTKKIIIHQ